MTWCRYGDFAVLDDDVFFTLVVMVRCAVDGVKDLLSGAFETVTERVVMSVVVVISHINLVLAFGVIDGTGLGNLDLFVELDSTALCVLGWVLARLCALLLPTTRFVRLFGVGCGTCTVFPLGDVEAVVELVVVVFYTDLSVGVASEGLTVTEP